MNTTHDTKRRASAWRWMRRFNAQHPDATLAQTTGAALAAGKITTAERDALLRQAGCR